MKRKMTKGDKIDRKGRLTPQYKHRRCLDAAIGQLEKDLRMAIDKKERVVGVRTIALQAYDKGGKPAALKAIQEANKRIGHDIYTEEGLDSWIAEYLAKRNRDDDDAR